METSANQVMYSEPLFSLGLGAMAFIKGKQRGYYEMNQCTNGHIFNLITYSNDGKLS